MDNFFEGLCREIEKLDLLDPPIKTIIGHSHLEIDEYRYYDEQLSEKEFLILVYQNWGFDGEWFHQ